MGERALAKIQAGLESTRGTQVAATRKLYGAGQRSEKPDIIRPDSEERGTFVDTYRSQMGLIKAGYDLGGSVTFEDLAWLFQCALKGGVTGALRNTAAYDYIFMPTQSTDDLKSASLEDGDDTQAWKAGFAMLDTLEIVGALGQALTFTAKWLVDDWATASFTGAIGDRVVEDALTHLAKLAIGNAGAVPSSYMSGRFIGFKVVINNQLNPKFFADGAGSKYTGMGRKKRKFSLEADFEGNAATVTERANFDTGTARVARLLVTGSNIAGSGPATARTIDIVLPSIWTAYDPAARDTNTIFHGVLEAQYDSVLGYDLSATVTNGLSALP